MLERKKLVFIILNCKKAFKCLENPYNTRNTTYTTEYTYQQVLNFYLNVYLINKNKL